GAVAAPFSASLEAPFTLAPGASRSFPITYTPQRAPHRDSLLLSMIADNPVPAAMAFLFDASNAMGETFGTGSRIEAARAAAGTFIDDVMADGAPAHEGAVYAYSAASQFRLLRGFTPERSMVKGALPSQAIGSEACPWDAMHRTIGFLQTRPLRKVLIVFLASENAGLQACGPRSASGVISAAQAADVQVNFIAFTNAEGADLQAIALMTGGSYLRVSNETELTSALNTIASTLQYRVPQQFVFHAESVAPVLRITPPHIVFPLTRIDSSEVREITLHNDGTAPMHVYSVEGMPPTMRLHIPPDAIGIGDSAAVPVEFLPVAHEYVEAHGTFDYNACRGGSASFVAYGVGYGAVHYGPGPVLSVPTPDGSFGEVDCSGSASLALDIANPGSETLTVSFTRSGSEHFLPEAGTLVVEAEGSEQLTMTCTPEGETGVFTGTLTLEALARGTTSTVAVVDLGVQAAVPFDGVLPHGGAVELVIGELAAELATSRTLEDRLGVIAATDGPALTLQPPSGDRSAFSSLRLPAAPVDSTCVYAAVSDAIDMLKNAAGDRRIILFSAVGDPDTSVCPDESMQELLQRATAADITLEVILLDQNLPATELTELALGTGGGLSPVNSMIRLREEMELIEAARRKIRRRQVLLSARSVSALLHAPESLPPFAATRVGGQSCQAVVLRNIGDGPLVIGSAEFFHDDYKLSPPPPISIDVGDSLAVDICFAPRLPGEISSGVRFITNSCTGTEITLFLTGLAWDSSSVTIGGNFLARPGGLVRIPVRMTTTMDEEYGMRALDFSVAYNPTLLYPDTDLPAETGDGVPLLGTGRIVQGFDALTKRATTTYEIRRSGSDPPITTSGSENTFAWLRFRTYLGNSMETAISVDTVHAYMPGLTLGASGVATVRLDSLTWLAQRLVDPSALYNVSLGKNLPNPVRGETVIPYSLLRDMTVRLTVYDSFGRRVRVLDEGLRGAGTHSVRFHSEGLPAGLYFYRLETPAGARTHSMIISR
ncbi:MAG: T9SS type A sorting domain-containing protein, partial [Bacteroidota bacterium]|nr:T9SS type A sorting domain-containing protein [Bacteroidota bacterium]